MIFEKFLQSHKWQHKDAAIRIDAIRELAHATEFSETDIDAAKKIIHDLAISDSDTLVRVEAIAHLSSHEALSPLAQDTDKQISEAANKQLLRVISGSVESELNADSRVEIVSTLPSEQELMSVTLDCGCEQAGLAALARLKQEFSASQDTLLKIATESHNHSVRFAAAADISDLALLEKLSNTSRHKDRAVFKLCRDQLQAWKAQQQAKQDAVGLANDICATLEALAKKPINSLARAQYEYKISQWQELNTLDNQSLVTRFETASNALQTLLKEHAEAELAKALELKRFADLAAASKDIAESMGTMTAPLDITQVDALDQKLHSVKALSANSSLDKAEAAIIAQAHTIVTLFHELEAKASDILQVQERLDALTNKNTAALARIKAELYKLFTPSAWPNTLPGSAVLEAFQKTEQSLEQLLEKNRHYLEKLHKDSLAHIEALEQHIEKGEVNEAQRMWDKVQGAIKNADESLKKTLKDAVAPYKEKVSELVDWKNFAAQQKKKEFIQQMHALIDDPAHAPEKAKRIKALQEQWKSLGHSLHNDTLWVKFNEAARLAFEPCKEYFKERKAKLHSNFVERNKICDALEALVAGLNESEIHIAELNKTESKALEEWKLYAPVEQSKINKLQKRFNAALSALRQVKRKTLQANAAQKLALIDQAQKLDALEDIGEALNEAKKLQAQWKLIGPSPHKEDRNHWNSFRAACDTLFNKRSNDPAAAKGGKAKPAHKTADNSAVAVSREVLKKITALMHLSSEDLINTRKQFSDLQNEFEQSLNADLKHEKRKLQEQFNRLSKQYESRLQAAPDRKSLQLIGQLKTKSAFCESLEESVLAGVDVNADLDALNDQWQDLGNLSDLKQEQTLEQRFHALCTGVDSRILKKQAKDNADKAREICISAEIHASIDSPDADKALRMQVQLLQLKNSFGSRGAKSPQQLVSDLEMQLMCLGPIEKNVRNACMARLTKAKNKL